MAIALIGASGRVGSRILKELLQRGYAVTAIARHPEQIESTAGVTAVHGDVAQTEALAATLRGHEAVVSSVQFTGTDLQALVSAVRASEVPRWLIVGGAGSLFVRPGAQLVDEPYFPAAYRAEAGKGREFLELLKRQSDLDWTFISPSAFFEPGERTGRYRIGGDELLTGADGKSLISFEDFAKALVDELEHPAHRQRRFTVGY